MRRITKETWQFYVTLTSGKPMQCFLQNRILQTYLLFSHCLFMSFLQFAQKIPIISQISSTDWFIKWRQTDACDSRIKILCNS
jgi:hypothetical protein